MRYILFDEDTINVQNQDFTMNLLKNYINEYRDLAVRRSLILDGNPLYVHMSHDTCAKLKQISSSMGYIEARKTKEGTKDKVFDCSIIYEDDLKFGVVDVR